uniref:Uncharacterized protein n=1 Tax=Panagrolaimus sp. ES5 TaxID=591445 RepID=A0AC34GBT9_9BILA
ATTRKAIRAPLPAINGSTTEDSSIDETHGSFTSPTPPAAIAGSSSSTSTAALPATSTTMSNGQSSNQSTSHSITTQAKPETDSAVHRFFRRSSLLRRTNPLPRRSNEPLSSLSTSAPLNNNNTTNNNSHINTALPPISPNNQYASLRIKNPIIASQLLQSPNGVGCCGLPQRRAPIAAIDDEIGIIKGRPSSAYENA